MRSVIMLKNQTDTRCAVMTVKKSACLTCLYHTYVVRTWFFSSCDGEQDIHLGQAIQPARVLFYSPWPVWQVNLPKLPYVCVMHVDA